MKLIIPKRKRKKILVISIISILIVSILTFIVCLYMWPRIILENDNLEIPVFTKFKEPKYEAYIGKFNITNKVKKHGKVNINRLGEYKIKYEVKYYFLKTTKNLTVKVIDDETPIIELKGSDNVSVCPNKEYQEEGYQAKDNYDGDLTNNISIIKEQDKIIYSVKDKSGNSTTKIRNIHYEDKKAPILKLKGSTNVIIYKGEKYEENGISASDNCDGDISNNIIKEGEVNPNKIGNYFITYKVSDSSGNVSKIIRNIKVVNKSISGKGIIYLTFDDGPSSSITPKLLDILKKEQVPATFFVINHSNDLDYLIKREDDEGHTVGLHSYSHNYAMIYESVDNYFNDLTNIQNKVFKITGKKSFIIRFPGGSSNTVSKKYQLGIMSKLVNEVQNKGYHYFDWNIASGDAGGVKSSKEVYNNVIANLSKNRENIILMHDFENNYYTLNAIEDIIHYGKENGYIFKKITLDTPIVTHKVAN